MISVAPIGDYHAFWFSLDPRRKCLIDKPRSFVRLFALSAVEMIPISVKRCISQEKDLESRKKVVYRPWFAFSKPGSVR